MRARRFERQYLDRRGAAQDDRRPRLRQRRGEREIVLMREPPVGQRLFDDHLQAAGGGPRQRALGRALVQVPGRLHGVEQPQRQRLVDRLRLARAADRDAERQVGLLHRAQQRVVAQHAALGRRRMDLVEREPLAELLARLGQLALERREVVVLDLRRVVRDLPARRVHVAPLGADRHPRRVVRAQPLAQELLGQPVGAGGVEVAHALLVGEVEHLVRARAQGLDRAIGAQLLAVTDVQVARAAERGES